MMYILLLMSLTYVDVKYAVFFVDNSSSHYTIVLQLYPRKNQSLLDLKHETVIHYLDTVIYWIHNISIDIWYTSH